MRLVLIALLVSILTACTGNQTPLQGNYLELSQRNIIERDLTVPYGIDNPNIDKSLTAVAEEGSKGKEMDADSKELVHER